MCFNEKIQYLKDQVKNLRIFYCSEDARLDAVRKTETASTATNNQGKDVAYENLFRKKYKVLKNMTTEKPKKNKKKQVT